MNIVASKIRFVFAPLILRFQETEELEITLEFLGRCDLDKLNADLAKFVVRTEFLIAKELLRRGVRIWEF